MNNLTKEDLKAALRAVASMMDKTAAAKAKFPPGTSQHTLQRNRLEGLQTASSLISKELDHSRAPQYGKEELEKAVAPIASLISKSEKARNKLAPGTWQHTMLGSNLKALYIASPLLTKALNEIRAGKG
jgi:hypothetical protein